MNLQEVVKKFEKFPVALTNGAGHLSKRWKCTPEIIYEAKKIIKNKKNSGNVVNANLPKFPKILILDIETAPLKVAVFGLWKQKINYYQMLTDWYMLSWSAKWLGSTEIMGEVLTPTETLWEDDSRIVNDLWALMDSADLIIAHNGDGFDIPMINVRFLKHGLNPPSPFQSIDTYRFSRKSFRLSSHKLDAIAKFFGIEGKNNTEFELWKKCLDGDPESLEYMLTYNKQDVNLLEEVYIKMRPWIKPHPNVGLYMDSNEPVCHTCGSKEVEMVENKYYYTMAGKYPVHRCNNCGSLSRGRKNVKDLSNVKIAVAN